MAKARSPEYPAIGLKEAIERVSLVYKNDYQNKIPRSVVANHMGYSGMSGKALAVLAALLRYGLLEGRAEETSVSDLAVTIVSYAPGSPERAEAVKMAASKPELFATLDAKFGGRGSEAAIRSWLLTNGFIPTGADSAIRSYRETKALVEEETKGYTATSPVENTEQNQMVDRNDNMQPSPRPETSSSINRASGVLGLSSIPENEVKVLLSGDRLQVTANVDLKGLKKLRKILDANEKLLQDEEIENDPAFAA